MLDLKDKFSNILKKTTYTSPWVLPFLEDQFPLNLKEEFPNYSKYVLEIGSGWGEFTIDYAFHNKDSLVIALEKKKKRIIHCSKLQESAKITNIRWFNLNIDWFLEDIFTKQSFDKVIINFPDPWPKKRHHKHRFVSTKFLTTISNFTKEGSIFEFATDYWEYLQEVLFLFENTPLWYNINGKGIVLPNIPNRKKSYFEILTTKEGKHTYFLQFQRTKVL